MIHKQKSRFGRHTLVEPPLELQGDPVPPLADVLGQAHDPKLSGLVPEGLPHLHLPQALAPVAVAPLLHPGGLDLEGLAGVDHEVGPRDVA